MAGIKYPEPREALINPYTEDDFRRMEDALRRTVAVHHLIERCKRCQIPVEAVERDCDACYMSLQAILGEFRGPNAPIP